VRLESERITVFMEARPSFVRTISSRLFNKESDFILLQHKYFIFEFVSGWRWSVILLLCNCYFE
jgi:hypothetical protein